MWLAVLIRKQFASYSLCIKTTLSVTEKHPPLKWNTTTALMGHNNTVQTTKDSVAPSAAFCWQLQAKLVRVPGWKLLPCKTVLELTQYFITANVPKPSLSSEYWEALSKWFRANLLFKTSACILCQSKNTKWFSSCSDSVNPCLRVCLGLKAKDWGTWCLAAGVLLCCIYVYVLSGYSWLCKWHPFVPVPVGWTEFIAREWPWAQGKSPVSSQD